MRDLDHRMAKPGASHMIATGWYANAPATPGTRNGFDASLNLSKTDERALSA
jgi:hypothetical protein